MYSGALWAPVAVGVGLGMDWWCTHLPQAVGTPHARLLLHEWAFCNSFAAVALAGARETPLAA